MQEARDKTPKTIETMASPSLTGGCGELGYIFRFPFLSPKIL